MKKVIIMRGVSGAGKGHYVKELVKSLAGETSETDCQVTVCSADYFFEKNGGAGLTPDDRRVFYDFDVRLLPEAHSSCMTAFLQALVEGHEMVVVDNTNIRRWMVDGYVRAARLADYDVEIVEIMPVTVDELRRCAARNSHKVPAEVVARMAMEFEPYAGASIIQPGF